MKKKFGLKVSPPSIRRVSLFLLLTMVACFFSSAQTTLKITGTVMEEGQEPIIGANVVEVGTTNGTVTDVNGNYSITVSGEDAELRFTFIGFAEQIVSVKNQSEINIVLKQNLEQLREVVVVGYGSMKKSDIVGSLSSVKTDEMVNAPTADVGSMLLGRAPGIQVTPNNAEPGGSSNILIRGRNSISGGNAPLVIVDGVPFIDINDVNPNAIERVEVLKDAASQAIYGARASNGVILITTKTAKEGKTSISYDNYFSFQNTWRNFEFMDGFENAQIRREAQRFANERLKILDGDFSDGWEPEGSIFPFEVQQQAIATGQFVDWEDVAFNPNALKQNHSINLTGGTEKFKYSSSLRYFNQDGVLRGSGYDQYDIRTNAELRINKVVTVGTNITYSHTNRGRAAIGGATIANSVLASLYNEDGTYRKYPNGEANFFNPLINMEEVELNRWQDKFILNLYADLNIIDGLKYRIKGSTNQRISKEERYYTSKSSTGQFSGGEGYIDNGKQNWLMLENILTYNKDFGTDHTINATFVNALEQQTSSSQRINGEGFSNDLLGIHGIETALLQTVSHSQNKRSLVSYMGRIQYSFKNRYIINATMRADGSSVFSVNNKWGYFPSLALGWNISQENFMVNLAERISLDNLKIRASYGQVGNQAISPYQTLGTANDYGYVFGETGSVESKIGYAPGNRLPNPNLRWETTTTLNTALDFVFLGGKVSGSFEYYNSQTTDLLLSRSIPAMSGYTTMRDNLGQVENQGLELSLNYEVLKNKDFTLSLGTNLSGNRNKIVALYGDSNGDGIEDDNVAQNQFIGYPIDVYYDYQFDGVWQPEDAGVNGLINAENGHAIFAGASTYPGDIRVADVVKDGVINADDRVIMPREADWMGSFTLNARYKNFDFMADFYTVQGQTKLNPYLYQHSRGGGLNGNKNGISRDYYTPEKPSLTVPRPNTNVAYLQTLAYQDASYWRLRNLTIGYSLPTQLLQKTPIQSLRIYFTGFNLLTWTDYLSYSPEIEPDEYPETRDLMIGLNIKF